MSELIDLMENLKELSSLLPVFGLYAETHYRFRIPFSRYFMREPEIIFDAPWHVEPGKPPAVFLLIKDAHLFPIHLTSIRLKLWKSGEKEIVKEYTLNTDVSMPWYTRTFMPDDKKLSPGEWFVLPELTYTIRDHKKSIRVDNYRFLEKYPLRIYIAELSYPNPSGWLSGDMHIHSSLTNDQVEFGAPLEITRQCADFLGMDFIATTDHSYDLDDLPDDFLTNDPELRKWNQSRQHIRSLNQDELATTILPAEEISVTSAKGKTVHLLHYNDNRYFPGSGDSGETWPDTTNKFTIGEILRSRSNNTVSIGAHVSYRYHWLQRLLLQRGHWQPEDALLKDMNGLQILSGTPDDPGFEQSKKLWIHTLLKDMKLCAVGGSDAHGNFNRFRQVGLPMWSLIQHEDQILGQVRTLVRAKDAHVESLINAIQMRRTAITTGPAGELHIFAADGVHGEIGDTVRVKINDLIHISWSGISTEEFGKEIDYRLIYGDVNKGEEQVLRTGKNTGENLSESMEFNLSAKGYVRLELNTRGSRWPGIYLSSPIWLEPE